jgi:arginyl-tRNA synthetase
LKEYLYKIFNQIEEHIPQLNEIPLIFEVPKSEQHGDISSNAALLLSKKLKKNPREIANDILRLINYDSQVISKIEIAGAGFINFFFNPKFYSKIILKILEQKDNFGKSDKYSGKKANVEFVSANPTGPLTVGHGRNAVLGDTIANLLEWIGYQVDREYYFNNAGRQMRVLGDSVRLRYLELLGIKTNFPDDYYQGDYIKEIAIKLFDRYLDKLKDEPSEGIFKEVAEQEIFADIKNTLLQLNINHNIFFNEKSLYDEGNITVLLKDFEQKNITYQKDDALWLKLTALGKEQDKVIVKSSGEPTYRLPDIAYHITKINRGYDLIVDLFGSDHNATYPDVIAALSALGYDGKKVKVLIHQFVTITRDGEIVKMSTRKANYITLDELIGEVGRDVVRYFFNMRNISSHMNFDLTLAKKQSDENPVFYLQYAHARICSILRTTEQENLSLSTEHLELLNSDEEKDLLKKLNRFEEEVLTSAENFESHRICLYLEDIATSFHKFYTFRRVIGSENQIAQARIALISAVKIVLKNGLTILGVDAPEKM